MLLWFFLTQMVFPTKTFGGYIGNDLNLREPLEKKLRSKVLAEKSYLVIFSFYNNFPANIFSGCIANVLKFMEI